MRTPRHATNATRPVGPIAVALVCALAIAGSVADAGASASKPALIITGAGLGHGVGMSQYGADGYARHGFDYATILGHYYVATTVSTLPSTPTVRVLLAVGSSASFSGATRAGGHTLSRARRYSVVAAGGGRLALISSTGRSVGTFAAPLRAHGTGPLRLFGTAENGIRDGRYHGTLEFRRSGAGVQSVDAIDLESYVRGVVAAEVPSSWPAAALEAQAVAARTYAIAVPVAGDGYTQYADTRSQEYQGISAQTPATNAAVAATAGQIVSYLGKPVATYFFSSSGGETEDIQNVFLGTTPDPWLTAVDDPYDSVAPDHHWGPIELSLGQVDSRLGGLIKGRFRSIRVVQRGASPRIVRAEVVGSAGTTTVTGPELQSRLGLDDTWASFSTTTTPAVAPPTPVAGAPTATTPVVVGTNPNTGGASTPTSTTPAPGTTTPATGGVTGP